MSREDVLHHPSIKCVIEHLNPKVCKDTIKLIYDAAGGSKTEKPKYSFASTASFSDIKQAVMPNSYNPFNLPTPEDDRAKTFQLPVGCNNVAVFSDIHCPFHDISALTTAFKFAKERHVNTIYLNGDIIDFYTISRFIKKKNLRNLPNELHKCREFLTVLRDIFSDCTIYYKIGNHDLRWDNYIASNAGEFEGMEEFSLSTMLHLPKHKIHIIESSTVARIGNLNIIHGHELFGSGGVNPARALFLKTGCSTMQSHVHRTTEHTEPDLEGKIKACWSIGCLADLRPEYNPNSKYNHGCAQVQTDGSGSFHVDNKKIFNGKIL